MWSVLIAVIILYVLMFPAPAFVSYISVFRKRKSEPLNENTIKGTYYEPFKDVVLDGIQWIKDTPHEDAVIDAFDGEKLYGRYYNFGCKKTAILLHGYKSNAENTFCGIAKYLAIKGFDLIIVDERAHGKSSGRRSTLGIKEQQDVLAWVDYSESLNKNEILLWGVSMGATSVAYASDRITDPVKALIIDAAFSSPYEQIYDSCVAKHVPTVKPLLWHLCKIVQWDMGVDIRASVRESLACCKIPALFIHGELDDTVPEDRSLANCAACASPSQYISVPGAEHAACYLSMGEEQLGELDEFINNYFEV